MRLTRSKLARLLGMLRGSHVLADTRRNYGSKLAGPWYYGR
jgi:hypothetical protein